MKDFRELMIIVYSINLSHTLPSFFHELYIKSDFFRVFEKINTFSEYKAKYSSTWKRTLQSSSS